MIIFTSVSLQNNPVTRKTFHKLSSHLFQLCLRYWNRMEGTQNMLLNALYATVTDICIFTCKLVLNVWPQWGIKLYVRQVFIPRFLQLWNRPKCLLCLWHNFCWVSSVFSAAKMDAGEDQNTGTTNGNPQTSGNSRPPQIAHMSLYERQAVQVSALTNTYM